MAATRFLDLSLMPLHEAVLQAAPCIWLTFPLAPGGFCVSSSDLTTLGLPLFPHVVL